MIALVHACALVLSLVHFHHAETREHHPVEVDVEYQMVLDDSRNRRSVIR